MSKRDIRYSTPKGLQLDLKRNNPRSIPGKKKWKCKKGKSDQHDWYFHDFWKIGMSVCYDCLDIRCSKCGKKDIIFDFPIFIYPAFIMQN